MPVFLSCCFFTVVWFALADVFRTVDVRSRPFRKCLLLLLPVMLPLAGVCVALFAMMGMTDDLLLFLLPATMLCMAGCCWKMISTRRESVSPLWAAAFSCCTAAILTITVFARDGSSNTDVLLSFGKMGAFLQKGNLKGLEHILLNVLLFIPFGFCLCRAFPGGMDSLHAAFTGSLWLSAMIETTQYLFRLGQCDLEDILANTLGAMLGFGCLALYNRYRKERSERTGGGSR